MDRAWDLDDRIVGQLGQCAVVAHIDDLHIASVVPERREELHRRLAVERAASAHEQLGLGVDRGVAVDLQQLALDVENLLRPSALASLLGDHRIVLIEVAQVVRGDRAERLQQVAAAC
jgi:hypothetical protein